ncbi:hypothetical protein EYF80_010163 [Liparis tanakae]|uniref:Uncharacterized protein n=1 Tax=Liparis tanakae TaxID=230148 RepID=A0A4Z2IP25_9TELE|nr:hypothetical protein EYF80_010163 [Liparis tanakae]
MEPSPTTRPSHHAPQPPRAPATTGVILSSACSDRGNVNSLEAEWEWCSDIKSRRQRSSSVVSPGRNALHKLIDGDVYISVDMLLGKS